MTPLLAHQSYISFTLNHRFVHEKVVRCDRILAIFAYFEQTWWLRNNKKWKNVLVCDYYPKKLANSFVIAFCGDYIILNIHYFTPSDWSRYRDVHHLRCSHSLLHKFRGCMIDCMKEACHGLRASKGLFLSAHLRDASQANKSSGMLVFFSSENNLYQRQVNSFGWIWYVRISSVFISIICREVKIYERYESDIN